MFQSFDNENDPSRGAARVASLRDWLVARGMTGFLVPRADEHQGEYVPPSAERLHWLTGFSGSAGIALVLLDRAVIFVDGRYTLQVTYQVDMDVFTPASLVDTPPSTWIRTNLGRGARIGFDPWLHTIGEVKSLRSSAEQVGVELVALDINAVDAIWHDRPAPPLEPAIIQPLAFAGEMAKSKLARLAERIATDGATHTVLTDPSSLAWAFNIRGNDVPHTPLALGFAVLAAQGRHSLFLDSRKLDIEAKAYLTQLAELHEPSELTDFLTALAGDGARIALDPALAADRLRSIVEGNGGTVIQAADPARLPRATKNGAELDGARAAHRRDGAAMAKMLSWLDRQPPGSIDEIRAVTALEKFRRSTGEETQMPLRDVSFDTISGAGPNGAIIHYRVSRGTSRRLGANELFLLDSGAQYQDGTTDVTRTVIVGNPTDEMRERYTLVLKGMVAISMLRFPVGTRGADIDAFARVALWQRGLDYAHGTGHGVGAYLAVHEGPQRIAKTGMERLLPGMILSNEPGYYKPGAYGIRIENLIVVTGEEPVEGGDLAMHGFETLTLVPFDRRLIEPSLLTAQETVWLDAYNQRVMAEIGPMVDGETYAWLTRATAPIAQDGL